MAEYVTPLANIAAELSGASSVNRLAHQYMPGTMHSLEKRARSVSRGARKRIRYGGRRSGSRARGPASRMAPDAPQTTRQFGEVTQGDGVGLKQRTLFVDFIKFPPQGGNVGNRLGSTIKVSGVKLCERIVNRGNKPVTLHYCILQPKAPLLDPVENIDWKGKFFRSTIPNSMDEGQTTRYENFIDAGVTDEAKTYEYFYDCWGVNPDKYNVLMHKKIVLSPRDLLEDSAGADTSQIRPRRVNDYIWQWDHYLPLKGKHLAFDDKNDDTPNQPLLRVMWHQALDDPDWLYTDGVINPSLENNLFRYKNSVVYFKNALG